MARKRKKSRGLIPKILLLLAYAVVIAFIGAIFLMKNELRRVGFFGPENTAKHVPVQQPSSAPLSGTTAREEGKASFPPPSGTAMREAPTPPPRSVEELTQDDKKQLDDILRARRGKQ